MPPKPLTQTAQAALSGPAKDGNPGTPAERPHNYAYLTIPQGPAAPAPFATHKPQPATLGKGGEIRYPTMSDMHRTAALRMYRETGGDIPHSLIVDGETGSPTGQIRRPSLERAESPARAVVPRPARPLAK